ncbi:crocetin glucosyltransferase 2 [Quercus suber]|uniref:Crocetin glucosyltransferase 2 n=1 Tax=Quercus suber TaxID=58331 RepID=A0AAW0ISV9_QUESU
MSVQLPGLPLLHTHDQPSFVLPSNPFGSLPKSTRPKRCIEQIMTGPRSKEFKKNVAEFERAARVAVADGGSSDRNIQDFVNEIIGHSRRSL